MEELSELERKLNSIDMGIGGFIDRTTDWYFRPKQFERSGKLYEYLGVRWLKKLTDWQGKIYGKKPKYKNNYRLWDKTKEGLIAFDSQTRKNEAWHTFFTCYTVAFATKLVMGESDNPGYSIFFGTCLVVNIYAIMLQRYNRARLHNVIDKMETTEKMLVPYP